MITRRAEARFARSALTALLAILSAVPASAQSAGVQYDGYKSIVLNLAGEIKDAAPKGGKVGAIRASPPTSSHTGDAERRPAAASAQ